ncbi:glycosyltransferase family 2 protein [Kiritimatiellota bacterium B12222]|nr:glycosyltransferase family 2 protein [Kiritimatiellota bacterium B12222]
MNEALVSVIMPVYRAGAFLVDALCSLENQEHTQWELIAVDDNGEETSDRKVLEEFQHKWGEERVQLCVQPRNLGVANARNTAIRQSRGKYIAFLDADDEWASSRLGKGIEILEKDPEIVLVHHAVKVLADTPEQEARFLKWFNRGGAEKYLLRKTTDYLVENHICTSAVICRREGIRLTALPPRMAFQLEDWVTWNHIATLGYFYYDDEPLVHYRTYPESFTRRTFDQPGMREFAYLEMLFKTFSFKRPFSDILNLSRRILKTLWSIYRG